MKISIKISVLLSFLTAALAGCHPAAEDCGIADCAEMPAVVDDLGPQDPALSRFAIEVIGEGAVLVNEEPCTTADGICHLAVPPGTVLTLDGDFAFASETDGRLQEGQCATGRGCRVLVDRDIHIVADVDLTPEDRGGRHIERRPFGLLPGLPGVIVDDFHRGPHGLRGPSGQGGRHSD